jgi:hypothetical protein
MTTKTILRMTFRQLQVLGTNKSEGSASLTMMGFLLVFSSGQQEHEHYYVAQIERLRDKCQHSPKR